MQNDMGLENSLVKLVMEIMFLLCVRSIVQGGCKLSYSFYYRDTN